MRSMAALSISLHPRVEEEEGVVVDEKYGEGMTVPTRVEEERGAGV